MPVFERKSLKSQFFDSLYLRNLANPLRPELYLLGAGIGLLVWLFRPLEHFFFHWPMFFGIGAVGLIARTIERQKHLTVEPEGAASPPLPGDSAAPSGFYFLHFPCSPAHSRRSHCFSERGPNVLACSRSLVPAPQLPFLDFALLLAGLPPGLRTLVSGNEA
jgi:hypothetical protein